MQFVNSPHLVADFLRINCTITTLLKLTLIVLILHNRIEVVSIKSANDAIYSTIELLSRNRF